MAIYAPLAHFFSFLSLPLVFSSRIFPIVLRQQIVKIDNRLSNFVEISFRNLVISVSRRGINFDLTAKASSLILKFIFVNFWPPILNKN